VNVWRYIPPLEASGQIQMAIDTWLLHQHLQGQRSTLRFYTWKPPAISLGYHQRRYPSHWQHFFWQGQAIDLVRRPTGGRAVLHQGDLTYAVVTSGLPGNRMQTYQALCEFLIQGWRSLGITLSYGALERSYIHNPNCFSIATGADLVLPDGTKLIGSAQLHQDGAVLQHGSIHLCPNAPLFESVFDVPAIAPQLPLSLRSINLETIETIVETLAQAARECFGVELHYLPLSEMEWQEILAFATSIAV
jgi:lipoate-protein ligase A